MAEGRMLKRKITISKKLAELASDKARLLWFYMLPFTDVDGRIVADCEDIRDEIIRKQRKGYSLARIEECLQDLFRVGLIVLYEVNGDRFLEFTRFWDEQSHNRDREAESTIPAPTQGVLNDYSKSTPLKLSKVKLSKDKYKDYVFLSSDEYQKLVEKLGKTKTEHWIEALNLYIQKIGEKKARKKYNSHYAVILSWEEKENPTTIKPTDEESAAAKKREIEAKKSKVRKECSRFLENKSVEELQRLQADRFWQHKIWLIDEFIDKAKKDGQERANNG